MKRHEAVLTSCLLASGIFCAAAGPVAAEPAHLLKDVNRTLSGEMGSYPEQYARLGGITLFRAQTRDLGFELWRTDGTEAGTGLVKDIWPGPSSGVRGLPFSGTMPFDPAVLGSEALFIASDGVHGWELWKTDGTEAGTRMVKEIRPGFEGPFEARDFHLDRTLVWDHAEAGGLTYFAADDGIHGFELWRSDGTEAGTFLLQDIMPGPKGAFGTIDGFHQGGFAAAAAGNHFFFTADDGLHGNELWTSDGTPAGTVLVKDILPGPNGSYPGRMMDFGGALVFWPSSSPGGPDPWRSDGTEAGTDVVADLLLGNQGPSGAVEMNGAIYFTQGQFLFRTDGTAFGTTQIAGFRSLGTLFGVVNGRILLSADDGSHGLELWGSDGTAAGTTLLTDIYPGPGSSAPFDLHIAGGQAFFQASDSAHGREVWTSDGTEAGTTLAADITPGPASPSIRIVTGGGACYLFVYDYTSYSLHLWSTYGTPSGTRRLTDAMLSAYEEGFAPDGKLLFSVDDGSHGAELWRSDGTASGTALLKDINPLVRTNGSFAYVLGLASRPGIGERVIFQANDVVHGSELWVSDWTPQGTRLLKDICPGPQGSFPGSPVSFEGYVFFFASDDMHGLELWRSDGTEAGTSMVIDLNPGGNSGVYGSPVLFRGSIYFTGDDGTRGLEIWKSDGTAAGTVLAAETVVGPDSMYPDPLFPAGDTLYFDAYLPNGDLTLWKTDGTQTGTGMISDPLVAGGPLYPWGVTPLGGKIFFSAFDGDHGYEPWVSDGTEAGTFRLRDIQPGTSSSYDSTAPTAVMNGSIYFAAFSSPHSQNLWITDGTGTGTRLVKDLRPGNAFSGIGSLVEQDGTLYFTAGSSGFHAYELWKSDGTEIGTVPISPDLGAFPRGLLPVPGGLVFTAWDPDHGYELWRSDGTTQGTILAQDIAAGMRDALPQGYVVLGHRIFFMADDGSTGYEPWVARVAILMGRPDQAIRGLRADVVAQGLARGLETSLTSKLDAAARALAEDRIPDAITALDVFGKRADGLAPRSLGQAAAADLRQFAGEIIDLLESR